MARLRRVGDGEGYHGSLIESIAWNEDGTFKEVTGAKPTIGESLRVGSVTASTFSDRDWWMTTKVTEILEERYNDDTKKLTYVKFETENSTYEIFA
jgi:hypothetical protein